MVPKKAGKYRLINSAQRLNALTIRDASLPLTVDEFSEEFAGYPFISFLDLFLGYDQCTLAAESRDMTADDALWTYENGNITAKIHKWVF